MAQRPPREYLDSKLAGVSVRDAVEDMGRFYSSHDTLPAAFANAQRIEQAIIGAG